MGPIKLTARDQLRILWLLSIPLVALPGAGGLLAAAISGHVIGFPLGVLAALAVAWIVVIMQRKPFKQGAAAGLGTAAAAGAVFRLGPPGPTSVAVLVVLVGVFVVSWRRSSRTLEGERALAILAGERRPTRNRRGQTGPP